MFGMWVILCLRFKNKQIRKTERKTLLFFFVLLCDFIYPAYFPYILYNFKVNINKIYNLRQNNRNINTS